jgi:ankyrin repeat protein
LIWIFVPLFQGADVNSGKHEYGYTALHFAALSGNAELCHLLLMAGAKSQTTNSVGRTASQMAAFVGRGTVLHADTFIM